MKLLTLIAHKKLNHTITDIIHSMEQIKEFTLSYVEVHNEQDENDCSLSVKDKVVGYTECVRINIFLKDEDVKSFFILLNKSDISLKGNIVYWVTKIDDFGRI